MSVRILIGDCRERLRDLPDASVDSVVCDPPYHLTGLPTGALGYKSSSPNGKAYDRSKMAHAKRGFMGQTWDGGDVAFQPDTWAEVLRVLKPGAHLIAFSGTRTYHRMVCAIEDAGFEIRDQLAWVYGSGFPKSRDIGKDMDRLAGETRKVVGVRKAPGMARTNVEQGAQTRSTYEFAELSKEPITAAAQQWSGWGTALKPSWEPICLARKPLDGTVAGNVLKHGTGALNIDGCRIETDENLNGGAYSGEKRQRDNYSSTDTDAVAPLTRLNRGIGEYQQPLGRWPANLCHDGSDEVLAGFPSESGGAKEARDGSKSGGIWNESTGLPAGPQYADSGSAARFFYCAKATTEERGEGNNHPTVKPVALMRWLCRLVTPKGGTVLDPFMGSGSTGIAADAEQFNFVGCEMSPEYAAIAERRIKAAAGMFAEVSIAA